MAEIGVLEGYKHKQDVPDVEYLKLENQLSFPLYVVAKEIVNAYRSHLDPLNLTYTQYIVMMALWEYGDLSVKELGQVLRLDSGTLTPLLKKLEAKAGKGLYWALFLFVGIPLPGTGAWTGTLAASLLDMDFKKSVIAVMAGVILAGIIMGLGTAGVLGAAGAIFG